MSLTSYMNRSSYGCCLSLLFLLSVAALFGKNDLLLVAAAEEEHEHESCACIAKEYNFTIDCFTSSTVQAALIPLQANNCTGNCTSEVCKKNFYIIQTHHDYCRESDLHILIEGALHIYEETCESCEIIRQYDSNLPSCPVHNCTNNSGNLAFNTLQTSGCSDDCTSTNCTLAYRTLRVVHDLCPDGTIDTTSEQGIHNFEEFCGAQSCNVITEADSSKQLECTDEGHSDDDGKADAASANTTSSSPPRMVVDAGKSWGSFRNLGIVILVIFASAI